MHKKFPFSNIRFSYEILSCVTHVDCICYLRSAFRKCNYINLHQFSKTQSSMISLFNFVSFNQKKIVLTFRIIIQMQEQTRLYMLFRKTIFDTL